MIGEKTWYLWIDTELRLVHSDKSCPDAKMATKYNYLQSATIKTIEDAEALDAQGKACPRCVKREQGKRKFSRKGYLPPPGFRRVA